MDPEQHPVRRLVAPQASDQLEGDMSDTQRRLVNRGEDGDQVYMYGLDDTGWTTEEALRDHGLDVPADLAAEHDELNRLWREHQVRANEWLDSVAPVANDLRHQAFEEVLSESRTWTQFAQVGTCQHAAAVEKVTSGGDSAGCDECGGLVAKRLARNPDTGEFERTDEIKVYP